MRALPSIAGEFTTRGVPLTDRIEFLKWFAVVAMLVDHAAKFAGWHIPGGIILGRTAYPLFALAFGYALSVCPDLRPLVLRLCCFGLVSEALGAWALTRGWPLNVLFSFALAALVVHQVRVGLRSWKAWAWLALLWLVSPATEYGSAGFFMTLAAWWFFQDTSWRRLFVFLAASLLLLVPNGTYLGTLGALLGVVLLFCPVGVPRIKRAFYWVYAGQWPVFAIFKGLS